MPRTEWTGGWAAEQERTAPKIRYHVKLTIVDEVTASSSKFYVEASNTEDLRSRVDKIIEAVLG